tara:strand:- start:317 stop:820 length:504 start_codon:yes stop_codon:yes gene_type:complete
MKFDSLVEKVENYPIKTKYGTFQLQAFKQNTNQQIHIALTRGNWSENDKILTRIQSLNMTQNILQSLQVNDENKMDNIFKQLVNNKYSCMLFINKIDSNKSVEILHEIKPNSKEDSAPAMDEKDFGIGAQILHQLKIQKLSLLSNSDQIKRVGLAGYGLEIVEYVSY